MGRYQIFAEKKHLFQLQKMFPFVSLQNYLILQKEVGSSEQRNLTADKNKGNITIKYLKFSTTYQFTVRAVLTNGATGYPLSIAIKTDPFTLTVTGLKYQLSKNKMRLYWKPPPQVDPRTGVKVCPHLLIMKW